MKTSTMDRIEKSTVLRAPRSRIWRALTDPKAFGDWFQVKVEGPFKPGAHVRGQVTYPGWEHLPFDITIVRMEPERLFSWRWHPHAVDPKQDYSSEPTTLVECELTEVAGGTRLKIVESGFDRIPVARRSEAYRMNSAGWAEEVQNIAKYVAEKS